MLIQANRHIEELQTVDVICNKCRKSCKCPLGNYECVNMTADWGYSSKKDCEFHTAHLCESCYDEFIKSWIVPPEIEDPFGNPQRGGEDG